LFLHLALIPILENDFSCLKLAINKVFRQYQWKIFSRII
jgi:hypothetical protein